MAFSRPLFFKGPCSVLSNFYRVELTDPVTKKKGASAEHLYQSDKAVEHGLNELSLSILQAPDAFEAKRLSRDKRLRDNKTANNSRHIVQ